MQASCGADVRVQASEGILATAGGAYLRIQDGSIRLHAPGTVVLKASQHIRQGPASIKVDGKLPDRGQSCELQRDQTSPRGSVSGTYQARNSKAQVGVDINIGVIAAYLGARRRTTGRCCPGRAGQSPFSRMGQAAHYALARRVRARGCRAAWRIRWPRA